ncbi:XylR family transcriptional regulator [Limnoglobus roseus]|uniref:AraC family transcriptional regulator n=1 Tax=Limnoglobus roseus TaxID=2598579 RepID=A0A5C1AU76_9BACT|nr:DNA-binding transcriptional regulator [Limnoglobus roseus]QEL20784.1 AraC family transcriptional regulator [Limnoglobus roseus]
MPTPAPCRVGLMIETSNAYSRGLIRGVMGYARQRGGWSLWLAESERGHAPSALRHWDGDGLIARVENPQVAAAITATGKPVVDVSSARLLPAAPWVETDDAAIAQAAFEHLCGLGLTHFGYAGDERFNWSRWRQQHLVQVAAAAGFDCSVCPAVDRERWARQRDATAAWLAGLPRPVGVLACYDLRAREVLDACQVAGLRVPDDVAVLGVDNDELLCDLADPPLSSVAPNAARAGAEAAALLDRVLTGAPVPPAAHLIPPVGVIHRQSTDILAVDDPDVAAAVRFIRANAPRGIGVADVLRAVPVSRRVLEARFSKVLGHTPHEEIVRVQLGRAKELLVQTDLPLAAIADRVGFAHAGHLSVVFKKATGQSPGEYRRHSIPTHGPGRPDQWAVK